MAATPGAQSSGPAAQPAARVQATTSSRPEAARTSADLVREVERLRGVIHTAVAALSMAGAHDEASRIRLALESR